MSMILKTPALNQEQNLRFELEKFKQQTQYVCLKLGIPDWNSFLTDVRVGNIVKNNSPTPSSLPVPTLKPIQLPFPPSSKGPSSFDAIFNDLLENMSTKRSSVQKPECESPICREGDVRYAMGGDTSISDCSSASFASASASATNDIDNEIDTHKKSKWAGGNQQLLDEVIKNLQKIDEKNQLNIYDGFETFRKTSQNHQSFNDSFNESSEERCCNQMTTKKGLCKIKEVDEYKAESIDGDEWIKQSVDHERTYGMKQFLLALQNTKLRRQLKNMQKLIKEKQKSYD